MRHRRPRPRARVDVVSPHVVQDAPRLGRVVAAAVAAAEDPNLPALTPVRTLRRLIPSLIVTDGLVVWGGEIGAFALLRVQLADHVSEEGPSFVFSNRRRDKRGAHSLPRAGPWSIRRHLGRPLPSRVDVLTAPPRRHRGGGVQLEDPRVSEVRPIRASATEDEGSVGRDGDERVAAAWRRGRAAEGFERAPFHVAVDEERVAEGFALLARDVRRIGRILREAPVDDVRDRRAALHRGDAGGFARARVLARGLDPPALTAGIDGQHEDLTLVRARRAAPHADRLLGSRVVRRFGQCPRARAPSRGVGARRGSPPRVGLLGAHAGLDGTAGDGHSHEERGARRLDLRVGGSRRF